MLTLAVDKGSAYTKSGKFIIRSTIKEITDDISIHGIKTNGIPIIINGRKYIVGDTGSYATNLEKSTQDTTKLLIYTAIANNMWKDYDEINLVVGLPIGQFVNQREKIKNMLVDNVVNCKLGNVNKKFIIKKVEPYPECAGAFVSITNQKIKNKKILIIDIGGLSIDVALFNKKRLKQYSTYELGLMKLFNKISNYINNTYNTKLSLWDIEDILKDGLYVNGKLINDPSINTIIKNHVEEIIRKINLDYDTVSIQYIVLTGGGAELVEKYINYSHYEILPNSFLSNLNGFQIVAERIFNGNY